MVSENVTVFSSEATVTVDDLAETVTIPSLSATVTIKGFDFTFQSVAGYYALAGQDVEIDKLYIMAAAQGSYAVTGQDLGLSRSLILSADQGAYALSGQDLVPFFGYYAFAGQGSYALTGQDNTLLRDLLVANDPGSYAISGQDVTLSRDIILLMDGGSYNLGGQDMMPRFGFSEPIEQGSYTLTGQDVTLSRDLLMNSTSGSYTLTGRSVDLDLNYYLALSSGSYTLTGQAVTLVEAGLTYEYLGYTEGPASYSNPYTFTGVDVGDAVADRIVVVGLSAYLTNAGGNAVYSATIAGNSMTAIATPGGGHASSGLFYYNLTSGTTADIVMTSNIGNIYRARVHVWAVYGAGSTAPSDSDSDGSQATGNAASKTVTVNVPTGGVLIAHGRGFAAFSSFTPLGTNRDSWGLDNDSVSGSTDVTLTQASSTNISLVAASWGP